MRPTSLLLLSIALPAMAQIQPFSFGIKGGATVATPLGQTGQVPFILGPTVNFRILSHLSMETGLLFYRMGRQETTAAFLFPADSVTLTYGTERGRALEIPILAKVQILGERHMLRPYFTLGPAIRRTSLHSDFAAAILSGTSLNTTAAFPPPRNAEIVKWNVDPVAGVGVDFKSGPFHLGPEVRYSYWGAGTSLGVRKNQFELLFGFRF